MNIFNIHIEFDRDDFRQKLESAINSNSAGYICIVDANVLSQTHKDLAYRTIVNGAVANSCDGSSIAVMCNKIYGTQYSAYSGPEIFSEYIEKPYKQLIIGNTEEKFEAVKSVLASKGFDNNNLFHIDIPFVSVDEFDYDEIAATINEMNPDIIWVSLGAPKQEMFMSKILSSLTRGVMLGIGAAVNYYVGDIKVPKIFILAL